MTPPHEDCGHDWDTATGLSLRLSSSLLASNGTALVFGLGAPDAGVLIVVQRPFQTLRGYGAADAYRFRLIGLVECGTGRALRKEQLDVHVAARGLFPPAHRPTARHRRDRSAGSDHTDVHTAVHAACASARSSKRQAPCAHATRRKVRGCTSSLAQGH